MGKKKFIDKKKSATFQLLARDSSDPNYDDSPGSDRVFVRVDNNPHSVDSFFSDNNQNDGVFEDPNSIFADAPEDVCEEDEEEDFGGRSGFKPASSSAALPENVRREILELGFPDDGYNYLMHLREIKNAGGGSAYYHNSKAKLDQLPLDVKAYDASRLHISEVNQNPNEKSIYSVVSQTVNLRVQKVVDPEVAALLNDDNWSRFDSDVEDMEEDFVVQANLPEEGKGVVMDKKLDVVEGSHISKKEVNQFNTCSPHENVADYDRVDGLKNYSLETEDYHLGEKTRVPRLLDEHFDMLEIQEYGSDSDDYSGGSIAEEDNSVANVTRALEDHVVDELELDDKYIGPADILHGNEKPKNAEILDSAADVLRWCKEFGENYENKDEDIVIEQESSDESEAWDCETVISTYSNLDNHPGKIEAPGKIRKNKLAATVSGASNASTHIISLRGKEKLPLDFLPHNRRANAEKVKATDGVRSEQQKKKQHGQETKEEKKERKATVKEEQREARRLKKEMKGLYKCHAQLAQKSVAVRGPSSIPLS